MKEATFNGILLTSLIFVPLQTKQKLIIEEELYT